MTALAPALLPYLRRDEGGGRGAAAAAVEDGVVRISLLHYNTPAEVEGLLDVLREVL
jgi:selenocysteine lyase/cysteine desulfurase